MCEHGILAASFHFSKKLGHRVRSSTVHSTKANYLEEIKKLRLMGKEANLNKLPVKKQGRPPLLRLGHYSCSRHWSNEEMMIQYVNNIFVSYIEKIRQLFNEDKPALVIMDNIKGQITEAMTELLESHRIHTYLIPPNTTNRLQLMDISLNKPAKSFLKKQFEMWYSHQVNSWKVKTLKLWL